MKYILLLAIIVAGCAQLQHGQIQPVIVKDYKNKILFTTCSGAVENWASCYDKARNSCPKGYELIDKQENPHGGIRQFTFKCK